MQTYTTNIVNFARTSNVASTIYIFEAYDESWKPGDSVEKHWGLYTEADRAPKFNFDIASYCEISQFRNCLYFTNKQRNLLL